MLTVILDYKDMSCIRTYHILIFQAKSKKKKKSLKSRLLFPTVEEQEYVDDDDLFQGDIKLTPEQKALLQSDDATIENWNRNSRKWQRDHIPYVLDRSLCMLLITT